MERFRVNFARSESFDDGLLGLRLKFGVAVEKELCGVGGGRRSEGADGVDTKSRFVEE